jgi:hypothetical protein
LTLAAAAVVVVDVLTEEDAGEVNGCLFVVIAMSSMIHVEVHVDIAEARSILSALLVWIRILHTPLLILSRNLRLLLPHLQQHQQNMK